MNLDDALNIAQIILAVTLVTITLLQTKGTGFLGMFGGDSSSVYRTRRGLELRMFQLTIAISTIFFAVALINSIYDS